MLFPWLGRVSTTETENVIFVTQKTHLYLIDCAMETYWSVIWSHLHPTKCVPKNVPNYERYMYLCKEKIMSMCVCEIHLRTYERWPLIGGVCQGDLTVRWSRICPVSTKSWQRITNSNDTWLTTYRPGMYICVKLHSFETALSRFCKQIKTKPLRKL